MFFIAGMPKGIFEQIDDHLLDQHGIHGCHENICRETDLNVTVRKAFFGFDDGIGLPVCESIIKAHNGFFESENRPGGGATFRFGLPIQEVEQDD